MKNGIKLNVESINKQSITGWFINENNPENKKLLLYLDDRYTAFSFANIPRGDVEEVHGVLHCGFNFDLSKFHMSKLIELKSDANETLFSQEAKEAGVEEADINKQGDSNLYSFKRHQKLPYMKIDLSLPIDGTNWYYPEETGRWAGPGLTSDLHIPALSPDSYEMEMLIENAFFEMDKMQILLNGKQANYQYERIDKSYKLRFTVTIKSILPYWTLTFKFPTTKQPSSDLGGDQRKLAIFLCSVFFNRIHS